ncbi:MAG TPA: SDR family oxidoreductase [Tissierellia bacterium]|nr:SDR family oxidoreductase [Tissierellia bacterium]
MKQTDDKNKTTRVEEIEQRSEDIGREQLATRPGKEVSMTTDPIFDDSFPGANRLRGKVALITGGDSGIGRAAAVGFAKEGAKLVITYLDETQDAKDTVDYIKALGGDVTAVAGDIGHPAFCRRVVDQTLKTYGQLDILINNAGEQHPQSDISAITPKQLEKTFQTNVFGMFYLVQAALEHLEAGASIINVSSITAYQGSAGLLDYSSSKGAVASFTRSLAEKLAEKKIRVNAIAPGPIWTPLVPSTFDEDHVNTFGHDTLMKRAGQPLELTEAFIFLAWERASSYITGQTIHINGGRFLTT